MGGENSRDVTPVPSWDSLLISRDIVGVLGQRHAGREGAVEVERSRMMSRGERTSFGSGRDARIGAQLQPPRPNGGTQL